MAFRMALEESWLLWKTNANDNQLSFIEIDIFEEISMFRVIILRISYFIYFFNYFYRKDRKMIRNQLKKPHIQITNIYEFRGLNSLIKIKRIDHRSFF